MKQKKKNDLVIFQAKNGAIELSVDAGKETIWATQAQVVQLFDVDQSVVSRHIKNILKDGEINEKSNMQKMHNANSDKPITLYSLDIILSVGYRVNSKKAIEFRKWATEILRKYITNGYAINPSRIAQNYQKFLKAVEETKKLLPTDNRVTAQDTMELVKLFAGTWFSLDAYDKEALPIKGGTKRKVAFTGKELEDAIAQLKSELIRKSEATDIFSMERKGSSLVGIVGNVLQAFGGNDLYPSVEEKAVHLLYFIVKNHPFIDGNKRSGAFSFIWFLQKSKFDFRKKITPEALTALTLLIAESNPKDKDKIIGLVLLLLGK